MIKKVLDVNGKMSVRDQQIKMKKMNKEELAEKIDFLVNKYEWEGLTWDEYKELRELKGYD